MNTAGVSEQQHFPLATESATRQRPPAWAGTVSPGSTHNFLTLRTVVESGLRTARRHREMRDRAGNLDAATCTRGVIEQAKGIHGGLGLHTAADVQHGRAATIRAERARVPSAAYLAPPERFVRQPPASLDLPGTSWINPPPEKETTTQ